MCGSLGTGARSGLARKRRCRGAERQPAYLRSHDLQAVQAGATRESHATHHVASGKMIQGLACHRVSGDITGA